MKKFTASKIKTFYHTYNSYLKPYRKNKSEITCHTAINLINRYCTSLEINICGVLYPIYTIETSEENNSKYYLCSIRLPPNSVLNKTIKVIIILAFNYREKLLNLI